MTPKTALFFYSGVNISRKLFNLGFIFKKLGNDLIYQTFIRYFI